MYYIWISEYGLLNVYRDENKAADFELLLKSLRAISFAPVEESHKLLLALRKSHLWDPILDDFIDDYFYVSYDNA